MLKIIAVEIKPGEKALRLSGTISGAWVRELQQCCDTCISEGNRLILDLTDVQYADGAGVELLSQLRLRRVAVFSSTPLLAKLLEAHEACRLQLSMEQGTEDVY